MPPAKSRIYRHWEQWLNEHLRDSEHIFCWACQREFYTRKYEWSKHLDPRDVDKAWDQAKVLQICHIIPESLGGSGTVDNLFLLCPDCHDAAPDTAFSDRFLEWALSQSHFANEYQKLKDALTSSGIPKERYDEIAALFKDEQFNEWVSEHMSFHNYQNGTGMGFSPSTGLALVKEYLWYRDNSKPQEDRAGRGLA